MDISRSEVDEGEVYDDSLMDLDDRDEQILGSTDDEESYEPPATIDVSHCQQKLDLPTDRSIAEDETMDVTIEKAPIDIPKADSVRFHDKISDDADAQNEEQVSQRSPFPFDTSDADDYEPPEPAPLVQEPTLHLQVASSTDSRVSSPASVNVNGDVMAIRAGSLPNAGHPEKPEKTAEHEPGKVRYLLSCSACSNTNPGNDARANTPGPVFHPLRKPVEAIQVVS